MHKEWTRVAVATAICLGLVWAASSCSSTDGGTGTGTGTGTGAIVTTDGGESGGGKGAQITAATGGEVRTKHFRLVIPAGALEKDTFIAFEAVENGAPGAFSALTALYEASPEGLKFLRPATIEASVEGHSPARLGIFWKGEQGPFDLLSGRAQNGKLTALVDHLGSGFVARVGAAGADVVSTCWIRDTPVCGKGCNVTCRGNKRAVCVSQPEYETSCTVRPSCACETIPSACEAEGEPSCNLEGCTASCPTGAASAAVCISAKKTADCSASAQCECVAPGLYERALAGDLINPGGVSGPTPCASDSECKQGQRCVFGTCYEPVGGGTGGEGVDGGAAPACTKDEECNTDADAGSVGKCVDGACFRPAFNGCKGPEDCATGESCEFGACVASSGGGQACNDETPCPAGETCVGGLCRTEGTGAVDGGSGGSCPDAGTGALGSSCSTDCDCAQGYCASGVCSASGGGDGGGDGDGGDVCTRNVATGGACARDCDCAAGYCGGGVCTEGSGAGDGGTSGGSGSTDGGSSVGIDECSPACASGWACHAGVCLQPEADGGYSLPTCTGTGTTECSAYGRDLACASGRCGRGFGGRCDTADVCYSGMACVNQACTRSCDVDPCPGTLVCDPPDATGVQYCRQP